MRWIDTAPITDYSKEKRMYFVKKNNRKLTTKEFKLGFNTYEDARNALRKFMRSIGIKDRGFTQHGYSIEVV